MSQGGITGTGRTNRITDDEERLFWENFFTFYFYEPDTAVEEDQKPPKEIDPDVLKIVKVDHNIKENTVAHHTDTFDIADATAYDSRENLVVRRGQDFTFKIKFNRSYDDKKDDLRLVFEFGKRPSTPKGSYVEFILSAKDVPKEWGAYIKSDSNGWLTVVVTTPPTCAVGKWTMKIDVVKKKDNKSVVFRYVHKDPIYILFNPWCKDDGVFMENKVDRDEYILNETGKLYRGSKYRISPCLWNFGQFSGNILDCALYLLDEMSVLNGNARGDPVQIVRKLSGLVNDFDNNGILAGNWSGDYEGGVSPLSWSGSVEIIEKYFETKQPVKFGQCWVFSGVTTTLCRALGIPTRSVTNFASAHDHDGSMTIDTVFKDNEKVDHLSDSVWNYHVWNEVWMTRPELPKGYGGWQAIDATPQEASGGIFCCGPASVKAIKNGDVGFNHDGPFIFAEVNADRVFWQINEGGKMEKTSIHKKAVGMNISAKRASGKAAGRDLYVCSDLDREDLTSNYKFPEGSHEEKAAVLKASQFSTRQDVYETKEKDVEFEVKFDHKNTFIGDPFKLELNMKNTSGNLRTVTGTLVISTVYQTGITFKDVHKEKISSVSMNGKESKTIRAEVPVNDYLSKLTDGCMFGVSCMLMVHETKQTFVYNDDMRLRKPHLTIEAPSNARVGEKFKVKVSVKNPLPVTLTNCKLVIEGPGNQKPKTVNQSNVEKGKMFEYMFELTPVKAGKKDIIVVFNSTQIEGVDGLYSVTVTK
ncbi:annulin-like [Ruditapes philippinarum]|uniref:annulin-like n=1 Tax=Ruditapes philippinarum TaxID=129788 RepID=UPI00295BAA0A|nr:annulin-like [Ruditapes philippinarum]